MLVVQYKYCRVKYPCSFVGNNAKSLPTFQLLDDQQVHSVLKTRAKKLPASITKDFLLFFLSQKLSFHDFMPWSEDNDTKFLTHTNLQSHTVVDRIPHKLQITRH